MNGKRPTENSREKRMKRVRNEGLCDKLEGLSIFRV